MKRYFSRISIGLMALGLTGLIVLTALSASLPFHLVEHGTLTPGPDGTIIAEGTGVATHLGRLTVHRTFTLTPTTAGTDLEVNGQATLTAANGDRLESSIKGTLNPQTGHAVLIYEWNGGTGRFQNSTGTTVWLVEVHADQTYDVVADGIINY
ncbi:MAG: hypothetical protein AB7P14_12320 [Blastocatellales bacterium]